MCRAVTVRRQRNLHYFKWIQSKFRGKEKFNFSSLVKKKNSPPGNFVQQRQRNPTEKRASSCTCSPCRVMFCLLKPIAWIFLTLPKFPNETNRTDISFFLMTFFISTYLIKCSATGKACRFYYLRHSLKVLYLKCDSKLKDPHFN